MSSGRWRRLESLFARAVNLDPDGARELLERECGEDAALRARLEQLLVEDKAEDGTLRGHVRSAWTQLLTDMPDPPGSA